MSRARVRPIVLNTLVATAFTNVAWSYLNWRYKLGVGTIYVCPWVLFVTLWYGYRAQRLGLNAAYHGRVADDLLFIRVAVFPFLGAVVLPLLNFAISPQAPQKSLAVIIVASGASWYLYNLVAMFSKHVLKIPQ